MGRLYGRKTGVAKTDYIGNTGIAKTDFHFFKAMFLIPKKKSKKIVNN